MSENRFPDDIMACRTEAEACEHVAQLAKLGGTESLAELDCRLLALEKVLSDPGVFKEARKRVLKVYLETVQYWKEERTWNVTDFEVKNLLGVGGFGTVYLVTDKTSGDAYALKVVPKKPITRPVMRRFVAERDALSLCTSSEYMITMHATFTDKENLFMVLDYCPGGDLFDHINRNQGFPEAWARFYIAEVLEAVHFVHELGFTHRDVKPENLILDADGHLKLLDFGLCSEFVDPTHSRNWVGTPAFTAVEMWQGKNYDKSVDVWSIGVVFMAMIWGTSPFTRQGIEHVFGYNIPPILKHIIQRRLDDDGSALINQFQNVVDSCIRFPKRATFAGTVPDLHGEFLSRSGAEFLRAMVCEPAHRRTIDQLFGHRYFHAHESIHCKKPFKEIPVGLGTLRSQPAPISIKKHLKDPFDTIFFGESDIPQEQIPPLPEFDPMYTVIKNRAKEFGENSWNYSWNRGDEARTASLQAVCRQALGYELSNLVDQEFEKAVKCAEKEWVDLVNTEENPESMFDEHGNMKPEFIAQERERLAAELGSDHQSSDYSSSEDSESDDARAQPKRRVLGVKKTKDNAKTDNSNTFDDVAISNASPSKKKGLENSTAKLTLEEAPIVAKEVVRQPSNHKSPLDKVSLALPGITSRTDQMESRSQSESAVPAPKGGAGGLGLVLPGIQTRSGGRLDDEPHSAPTKPGTANPSFGQVGRSDPALHTKDLTPEQRLEYEQEEAHRSKIRMALAKKNLLQGRTPLSQRKVPSEEELHQNEKYTGSTYTTALEPVPVHHDSPVDEVDSLDGTRPDLSPCAHLHQHIQNEMEHAIETQASRQADEQFRLQCQDEGLPGFETESCSPASAQVGTRYHSATSSLTTASSPYFNRVPSVDRMNRAAAQKIDEEVGSDCDSDDKVVWCTSSIKIGGAADEAKYGRQAHLHTL